MPVLSPLHVCPDLYQTKIQYQEDLRGSPPKLYISDRPRILIQPLTVSKTTIPSPRPSGHVHAVRLMDTDFENSVPEAAYQQYIRP